MGMVLLVLQLRVIVYLERDLSKLVVNAIDIRGDGAEVRVFGFLMVDHDEVVVRYVFTRRIPHVDCMFRSVFDGVGEGDVEKLG